MGDGAALFWHDRPMKDSIPRRFLSVLASLVLMAGPAMAEDSAQPLGLDFATPGMLLGSLRALFPPRGDILYCGTDRDLPPDMSAAIRAPITTPDAQRRAGLSRCAVFAREKDRSWAIHTLKVAGNPAQFSILSIVDEIGPDKVAQITLWQNKAFFAATRDYLAKRFGPPPEQGPDRARWHNAIGEVAIQPDGGTGIWIFMVDNRLQSLMNTRLARFGAEPIPGANPQDGR